MDIYEKESVNEAKDLPDCYKSLLKGERSIVDRLTVGYFVNKLMTAGEIIPGISGELKPTKKSANVGSSKRRPMNIEDYNEIIGTKLITYNRNLLTFYL